MFFIGLVRVTFGAVQYGGGVDLWNVPKQRTYILTKSVHIIPSNHTLTNPSLVLKDSMIIAHVIEREWGCSQGAAREGR